MWSIILSSSLALLLFAPNVLAADACTGGRWASQPGIAINLRNRDPKGNERLETKVGQTDCSDGLFFDPWVDASGQLPGTKVKATNSIPADGKLQRKTSTTQNKSKYYTCDHLVELQMVKRAMEKPGGACDQALALAALGGDNPTVAKEKLRIIRAHTYQHPNLYMVEKKAETTKGNAVTKVSTTAGLSWFKINELYSLVVEGPGSTAVETARAIDAEIIRQFPEASVGHPTVLSVWQAFTVGVSLQWKTKKAKAEQQLCTARSRAAGGATTRKRAPTLPTKMWRRHSSALSAAPSSSALSPVGFSSLVARARKRAARSGPHAPPGRSCPASTQKQKKVISRNQVKRAAPPAKKPRKPSQRPAPRPANAKKQVAKRPASRARRDVGKPRVHKRTTPKRKPKVVPKSTRRPRGKPRQRRRRR